MHEPQSIKAGEGYSPDSILGDGEAVQRPKRIMNGSDERTILSRATRAVRSAKGGARCLMGLVTAKWSQLWHVFVEREGHFDFETGHIRDITFLTLG
jgi:hypothetical protein